MTKPNGVEHETTAAGADPGTELANWDAQLAEQAAAAAAQEASTGGWTFFSTRGGQLKINDSVLPGNHMAVVVLDSLLVNAFYPNAFDPDNRQPPVCYAMGRDEKALAPHAQAEQPQHPDCASCPKNQFGSKGRRKECRNTRRLALIPAGTLVADGTFTPFTKLEDFATAPMAGLAVPPTSVQGFSNYVKNLTGVYKLPPRAVVTKVQVVPDAKVVSRQLFAPLGPVPRELLGAIMKRAQEAEATIAFPFPASNQADAAPSVPTPAAGKGKDDGRKKKY